MRHEFAKLRAKYHTDLGTNLVRFQRRKRVWVPNFADITSSSSRAIARNLCAKLQYLERPGERIEGQKAGRTFEKITCEYLASAFAKLEHLRPGNWKYLTEQTDIHRFLQYRHLAEIDTFLKSAANRGLAASLGMDYMVTPDIVVARTCLSDNEINKSSSRPLVDDAKTVASLTPIRIANQSRATNSRGGEHAAETLILHASISCKWTIRSDRSQNTRTEALNLIRNRKGGWPRIMAVVAEPLPTRIASLALGTGELDCVYHFALHELRAACADLNLEDQLDMSETMITGDRLRDISDLPLDLVV